MWYFKPLSALFNIWPAMHHLLLVKHLNIQQTHLKSLVLDIWQHLGLFNRICLLNHIWKPICYRKSTFSGVNHHWREKPPSPYSNESSNKMFFSFFKITDSLIITFHPLYSWISGYSSGELTTKWNISKSFISVAQNTNGVFSFPFPEAKSMQRFYCHNTLVSKQDDGEFNIFFNKLRLGRIQEQEW